MSEHVTRFELWLVLLLLSWLDICVDSETPAPPPDCPCACASMLDGGGR